VGLDAPHVSIIELPCVGGRLSRGSAVDFDVSPSVVAGVDNSARSRKGEDSDDVEAAERFLECPGPFRKADSGGESCISVDSDLRDRCRRGIR